MIVLGSVLVGLLTVGSFYIVELNKQKAALKLKYNITVDWAEKLSNENLSLKANLDSITNELALLNSKNVLSEEINNVSAETNAKQNNGKKRRFYNKSNNPSKQ